MFGLIQKAEVLEILKYEREKLIKEEEEFRKFISYTYEPSEETLEQYMDKFEKLKKLSGGIDALNKLIKKFD